MERQFLERAMQAAIDAAAKFRGATSPNPPVGASAVDARGTILGVAAHEKAGTPHAEALLLETLKRENALDRVHTLLVTLEPCNHQGRTGPCTQAILAAGIGRVAYACADPNPNVAGGGAAFLAGAGIQVEAGLLGSEATTLVRPFRKWSLTGRPWVTVKQALNAQGSMIPPQGSKTFTSLSSLRYAHLLRRRADAILTGSGTVLADDPTYTVRHIEDFPDKARWLVVLDRRGRVAPEWLQRAEARKFRILASPHPATGSLSKVLDFLGKEDCLELLVEAGPTLTAHILESGLWDEHVVIQQGPNGDAIEVRENRVHGNY